MSAIPLDLGQERQGLQAHGRQARRVKVRFAARRTVRAYESALGRQPAPTDCCGVLRRLSSRHRAV